MQLYVQNLGYFIVDCRYNISLTLVYGNKIYQLHGFVVSSVNLLSMQCVTYEALIIWLLFFSLVICGLVHLNLNITIITYKQDINIFSKYQKSRRIYRFTPIIFDYLNRSASQSPDSFRMISCSINIYLPISF